MRYLFFLLALLATRTGAQTTGKIKWKSITGANYIYTGQIKNGKPHGRGFAVSDSAGENIFGDFVNGILEGRATILFRNGKIMTGLWKGGYANGKGVLLDIDKFLYYGNYEKGELKERVIAITSSDEIRVVPRMGPVGYNGRVICILRDGTTIADNFYVNHSKNGQGYQYDTEKQKMYEGYWENDEWKMATTGNYSSFMSSAGFGSSIDDDYLMIYSNRSDEGYLQDTCFLLDRKKNNRFFGYFNRGAFENGIEIIGDSTCVIGQFDQKGKQGLCITYTRERALGFGNYSDNQLNGEGVLINLGQQMVVDGVFSKGLFGENMTILAKDGGFTIGSFQDGQLNGEVLEVHADGSSVKKIYADGKLKK